MKSNIFSALMLACLIIPFMAVSQQNKKVSLKEENVTYVSSGAVLKGFIVYDQNVKGKRPAVIVVHEWWGLNDYAKNRARQLASLGYIAMAVDMYGDGKVAENPQQAQELATPFYKDPTLSKILAFLN